MTDFMNEEMLLTKEGYDKIVAEHEELVSVKRAEVAERIKEAISYGDISENAEYDSAKNEQAELEERIYTLENMIRKAKIVQEEDVKGDVVNVGQVVSTSPEKGSSVKVGDTITVYICSGIPDGNIEVPSFVGMMEKEASQSMTKILMNILVLTH